MSEQQQKPMTYSEQYGGDYLEPVLLENREWHLVIERIDPRGTIKAGNGRPIDKPIMHFRGASRAMPLNKTNAKTIALTHGNDMRAWIGKEITIYPTTCPFGKGKNAPHVACIRVKQGPIQVNIPEELQ